MRTLLSRTMTMRWYLDLDSKGGSPNVMLTRVQMVQQQPMEERDMVLLLVITTTLSQALVVEGEVMDPLLLHPEPADRYPIHPRRIRIRPKTGVEVEGGVMEDEIGTVEVGIETGGIETGTEVVGDNNPRDAIDEARLETEHVRLYSDFFL